MCTVGNSFPAQITHPKCAKSNFPPASMAVLQWHNPFLVGGSQNDHPGLGPLDNLGPQPRVVILPPARNGFCHCSTAMLTGGKLFFAHFGWARCARNYFPTVHTLFLLVLLPPCWAPISRWMGRDPSNIPPGRKNHQTCTN